MSEQPGQLCLSFLFEVVFGWGGVFFYSINFCFILKVGSGENKGSFSA